MSSPSPPPLHPSGYTLVITVYIFTNWNTPKQPPEIFYKKVFLDHRPVACNFIKKETLTQVFSCEFCEICKNIFFTEHFWTTAFDTQMKSMDKIHCKRSFLKISIKIPQSYISSNLLFFILNKWSKLFLYLAVPYIFVFCYHWQM